MAENNQKEDFEFKNKLLENDKNSTDKSYKSSLIAMYFSLCALSLITGGFVVYTGYPIVGTAFSAPCFIAILRYFLTPSKKK